MVNFTVWLTSSFVNRRFFQPLGTKTCPLAISTTCEALSRAYHTFWISWGYFTQYVVTKDKEACSCTPLALNVASRLTGRARNWSWLLGDEPGALYTLGEVGWAPGWVDGGGHGSEEPAPWSPPRRPSERLPEASRRGGATGAWGEGCPVGPADGRRRRLHRTEGLLRRFASGRREAGRQEAGYRGPPVTTGSTGSIDRANARPVP